jgi:hypothetical protein
LREAQKPYWIVSEQMTEQVIGFSIHIFHACGDTSGKWFEKDIDRCEES